MKKVLYCLNNVQLLSPASWRFPSFMEVPSAEGVRAEPHTYETLIASRAEKCCLSRGCQFVRHWRKFSGFQSLVPFVTQTVTFFCV